MHVTNVDNTLTDMQNYSALCYYLLLCVSKIEGEIDKAKKQIAAYKDELQKARVIRKHRQEYDALAKVCVCECACVCVMCAYSNF